VDKEVLAHVGVESILRVNDPAFTVQILHRKAKSKGRKYDRLPAVTLIEVEITRKPGGAVLDYNEAIRLQEALDCALAKWKEWGL